ncbi:MAG TPA: hypothetical protein VKR06_33500 [Ktedonosporobacter sp.]|nr:hypothetical protein [Ktedonosporobacter sp.]
MRELGLGETRVAPEPGEQVTYATLLAESKAMRARIEREQREQERLARQRHLQQIHDHQEVYWRQIEQGAERKTSAGYDDAVRFLVDLRDAAVEFHETQQFQARFHAWIQPHLRRPALLRRLRDHQFLLPEA